MIWIIFYWYLLIFGLINMIAYILLMICNEKLQSIFINKVQKEPMYLLCPAQFWIEYYDKCFAVCRMFKKLEKEKNKKATIISNFFINYANNLINHWNLKFKKEGK